MARILLIESDQILAGNLKQALTVRGHKVDWQVELQAAMNSADQKSPNLVILDLLLSSRSGLEFLYEFRSYPEWQKIPVIIFSHLAAEDLEEQKEALEQLQIASFHYRPTTSLSELTESVESALKTAVV